MAQSVTLVISADRHNWRLSHNDGSGKQLFCETFVPEVDDEVAVADDDMVLDEDVCDDCFVLDEDVDTVVNKVPRGYSLYT